MRILVALGGNALLRRGERPSAAAQRANIRSAVQALAPLFAEHELVITHGNGPQVGFLALQSEAQEPSMPLDVLGAESEGMIGYVLGQELMSALPQRRIVSILTQTLVDPNDPAFGTPTKPIGPVYDEAAARRLASDRGWTIQPDGAAFRRVVASPAPLAILEEGAIRLLLDHGVIVVCAGGGGVPVVRDGPGYRGVEAVVDKDRTSAVLAAALGMDALLILTDVDGVYADWGRPEAKRIASIVPGQMDLAGFPAGSMRPKIEAGLAFAAEPGRFAAIGRLTDAEGLLEGTAGTRIALRP
jgi:carbamate kinase